MITKPIIKNNVWIDKLYYIFFPNALKALLRAVKLSLFLFCFSASINIQSNSKIILIEPFSTAFSEELTIEKAKIAKAIWKIKVNEGIGTGFFISENKIVTNAHVVRKVKDTEEITIVQEGNPRRLKASKIVSLSIRDDLALLEVDGVVSDFIILPEDTFNSSNVYALGYPNGQFQEIRQTGALTKDYFYSDNFDISGASGSPLLNEAHQLAGVLYQQNATLYQQSIYKSHIMFIDLETLNSFIKDEYFLCKGNVQECFKSLRESFETNTQEVKKGGNSYNIYEHLSIRGDLPRAKWWLEKSAEQGFATAQHSLALMYYNGKGVEQNTQLARELLEKAVQQGYAPAQFLLALMYLKGEVEQNIQREIELLEKAALQGFAPAQYNLALMYYSGERVEQNTQLARELLEKPAQQGFAPAQFFLAGMYYNGEGGEQNTQREIEWLEKAAQQGYAPAQYNLALIYYNGKGVEQNTQLAIEWLEKAAQQGYLPAKEILDLL